MSTLRGDAPLITALAAAYGPDLARAWQALPYLVLPGEGFFDHLYERQMDLKRGMPALDHLPWPDVVVDCGDLAEGLLRRARAANGSLDTRPPGRSWARVARGDHYDAARRTLSPWAAQDRPDAVDGPAFRARPLAAADLVVAEIWAARADGGGSRPTVVFVPAATPWDAATHTYVHETEGMARDERARVGARMVMVAVLLAFAYLQQASEHLVEVTPRLTPAQATQDARSRAKRPALRIGLPQYILLDPTRAREYGQPAGERESRPGQARPAPQPHGRRGHWRELRADRYGERRGQRVWVRPAWIGPEQWEAEGQRYRVVAPASHPAAGGAPTAAPEGAGPQVTAARPARRAPARTPQE